MEVVRLADRIKGITVEIGGDTQGLSKALSGVNKEINSTQAELKDVERLLKLDPKNTELLRQKQELLAKSISNTEDKLEALKEASEKVAETAQNYDAWKAAYDPIKAQIDDTSGKLKELKKRQNELKDAGEINTDAYRALQEEIKNTSQDLADLKEQAKRVSDEFGNPVSPEQYNALQREIAATEISLRDMRTEAARTEDAINGVDERPLEEVGDAADGVSDHLEDMGGALKGMALVEAMDQLSGVADKIKEVGAAAADVYNQEKEATTKASAYFGETGEAAEETAGVIRDVYLGGVGESMDSVSDAVIAVKKNLEGLDAVTMKKITEQAITLDELYGVSMDESLRGVNALMEQYGISAQTAMDYVVKGTQNGLDKTDELGDNLAEYAGKFAQAGYSVEEYFQLLNNGLDGGAYNLDKVNDAINEVTTKLVDGSIADSMSRINEKTGELENGTGGWNRETERVFQAWQEGGATQKEVIGAIVEDIKGTENQQEALNKAALAFGTMAEDGNLKFIESLTTVGDTYSDVTGMAEEFFDQTTTPTQELESNIRQLKDTLKPLGEKLMELANKILPPIVDAVSSFIQWFQELPEPVQNFALILGGVTAALLALAPAIAAITMVVTALQTLLLPILGVILAIAAAIALIITVINNWGAITDWISEKWGQFTEFLGEKWEQVTGWISEKWEQFTTFLSEKWTQFTDFLQEKIDAIIDFFGRLGDFIAGIFTKDWSESLGVLGDLLNGFFASVKNIWDSIKRIFQGIVDFVAGVFTGDWGRAWNGVKDIFGGIFDALIAIAKAPLNGIIALVNGVISGINWLIDRINSISIDNPFTGEELVGFNLGHIGKIPYLAKGGVLSQGSAVVGEAGPELLTLAGNRAIVQPLTNQTTTNTNLGGVTVYVYGAPGQNVNELAEIVADKIDAAVARRGAAWGTT